MFKWILVFLAFFPALSYSHPIDRVKPLVLQVKTAVSAESPKSSYGSGFVVSRKGLIVTNYHVVDAVTQERDAYKVFVVDGEANLEADVLAIDVIHDLALLKVNKTFRNEVTFASREPGDGDRIYSLGFPMDLNLTVIEGTYNGVIRQGPYESVHMSAPLNSGMSGGPTVDSKGSIVGVNVSILGNSQNISFAVPANLVKKLIVRASDKVKKRDRGFYNALIEKQLLEAQQALTDEMQANRSQTLALPGWQIIKPSESLKCWSRQDSEKKFRYQLTQYLCDLYGASYVRDGALSGTYQLSYEVLTNQKLNPWQFFSLVNDHYNYDENFLALFFKGDLDDYFTRYECLDERLLTRDGIPVKVNYCMQGMIRYPDLVDAEIKFATLSKRPDVLIGRARLQGFTIENVKKFVRSQIDTMRIR